MKKFIISTAVLAALFASTGATAAGRCGTGYITAISEGSYNQPHFRIKLNDSITPGALGGYAQNGTIQFKSTMPAEKYRGIKALAYLAFSSGKPVRVFSTGTTCSEADELNIFIDAAAVY